MSESSSRSSWRPDQVCSGTFVLPGPSVCWTGSPQQRSIHVSSLWIEGSSVDPIGGRNSRRLCRRIEAALSRFWTRVDREIVVVAGASSDQQLLRVLASVKARRCAPPPLRGAHGLDAGSVRIPDEVERRFRTKWEHRFRRKWNIDSGKWNTDSGM